MLMPLMSGFSIYLNVKMSLDGTKHADVSTFYAFVVVLAWNLGSISLIRESCLL